MDQTINMENIEVSEFLSNTLDFSKKKFIFSQLESTKLFLTKISDKYLFE